MLHHPVVEPRLLDRPDRQLDAARVLGISRTTLWRKLKAFGLEVEE